MSLPSLALTPSTPYTTFSRSNLVKRNVVDMLNLFQRWNSVNLSCICPAIGNNCCWGIVYSEIKTVLMRSAPVWLMIISIWCFRGIFGFRHRFGCFVFLVNLWFWWNLYVMLYVMYVILIVHIWNMLLSGIFSIMHITWCSKYVRHSLICILEEIKLHHPITPLPSLHPIWAAPKRQYPTF